MPVRTVNSQRSIKVPTGLLRKAAGKALSSLGYPDAELSILVAGDTKMRRLNSQWRGIDATTDVLSFSMLEGRARGQGGWAESAGGTGAPGMKAGGAEALGMPVVLGDIVISAPRALAQSKEAGHSFEDELLTLLVHGILHIMGYGHEKGGAEKLRMEKKQREIIRSIKKA